MNNSDPIVCETRNDTHLNYCKHPRISTFFSLMTGKMMDRCLDCPAVLEVRDATQAELDSMGAPETW